MRVLIINYEFPPIGAGGGKASQKIASALVEMGHTVRVITSRPTQTYTLLGNMSLLLGVLLWVYLLFLKVTINEDISDHGFTLLGTLLMLTGFILRNTGLMWELVNPIRGLKAVEFIDGVEVQRIPVLRQRQDYSSTFEMGTFLVSGLWHSFWQVREFEPDVVHIFFGIPDGPIGWFLKRAYGLPYVISLRGADVPSDEVKRFAKHYQLLKPFIRWLWRDSDALVAVSNGLREHALKTTDIPIEVIPNAIDLARYVPLRRRPEREKLQLLFVGRFNAFKNVEALIEMARRLRAEGLDDFELVLVGEGSKRANLERLTVEYGLTKQIRFKGWMGRDALRDVYQQADLFITATTWEGMPNTVLEAMACGLPVVATNAAGLDQLVRNGENGYLVEINDLDGLTQRVGELIDNPYQRLQLGRESRKIAEQEFAWEFIAQQYVEIYERII